MKTKLLIFLSVNLALSSCGDGQNTKTNEYDACSLSSQKNIKLEFISSNIKEIIKANNEPCLIGLIDTLVNRSIRTHYDEYFELLFNIYLESDGYVSEYFLEVGKKLFYLDFNDLFSYMFKHKSPKMNDLIIHSLSMELSESENLIQARKKIHDFIGMEIKKYRVKPDQIIYIRQIEEKLDPDLFN